MELQQLRYVAALAQEGNFLRAAKRVNVTQPTLSQQMAKLEKELGMPLFERGAKEVTLTKAGKKLLPVALSVLDQIQTGMNVLKSEQSEAAGRIAVGAIPTICPYLMPKVLKQFKTAAPKAVVELYEETTSSMIESIKKGKLDLGILALPVKEKGFSSLEIRSEPFYLAAPKDHALASKKNVTLKDIHHERLLILQEGHCFSDQALEYCRLRREDPHVIFQGSSLTSVLKLVSSKEGLTLVPRMAVEPGIWPDIRFLPFQAPEPKRTVGIVWRLSAPLDMTSRLFIQKTEDVLG